MDGRREQACLGNEVLCERNLTVMHWAVLRRLLGTTDAFRSVPQSTIGAKIVDH
jgi:hypothetical protein